jgi:acetyltransferase-like isoleucine patch superfamily enzyme
MLIISPSAQVSKLADIEDSVRGTKITIGDGVFIDSFVKLRVAGGMGDVTIGPNCYINAGSVLYSGNGITLGEYVLIAANCTLAATNHEYADPNTPIRLQGFRPSKGGIVVEDDVWIGANCVLLDGTRIGRGAVVAAGSVVRGELPPYSISAGNPATVRTWRKKPETQRSV